MRDGGRKCDHIHERTNIVTNQQQMSAKDADYVAEMFCKSTLPGVEVANDADVMRQMSGADLLSLQLRFQHCGWMPFQPCVDGEVLVSHPLEAFRQYAHGWVSVTNALCMCMCMCI